MASGTGEAVIVVVLIGFVSGRRAAFIVNCLTYARSVFWSVVASIPKAFSMACSGGVPASASLVSMSFLAICVLSSLAVRGES